MNPFDIGSKISLLSVLNARENRVNIQKELLDDFPEYTLINYKCNIPGQVKNNSIIKQIFDIGNVEIQKTLNSQSKSIIHYTEIDEDTGPEAFYVVDLSPMDAKVSMVDIEERNKLGRLFDIDILFYHSHQLESLSRSSMNIRPRSCFVCEGNAKICGRSQAHSLEEVQYELISIISEDGRIDF